MDPVHVGHRDRSHQSPQAADHQVFHLNSSRQFSDGTPERGLLSQLSDAKLERGNDVQVPARTSNAPALHRRDEWLTEVEGSGAGGFSSALRDALFGDARETGVEHAPMPPPRR